MCFFWDNYHYFLYGLQKIFIIIIFSTCYRFFLFTSEKLILYCDIVLIFFQAFAICIFPIYWAIVCNFPHHRWGIALDKILQCIQFRNMLYTFISSAWSCTVRHKSYNSINTFVILSNLRFYDRAVTKSLICKFLTRWNCVEEKWPCKSDVRRHFSMGIFKCARICVENCTLNKGISIK